MKYKVGDEVIIKINENSGVKVQIISEPRGDSQYLCYVPKWESLKPSFLINREHKRYYGFPDKFLNETGTFISEETPIHNHIPGPDGEVCDKCKRFFYMAEKGEGDKFRCRTCKENPYR